MTDIQIAQERLYSLHTRIRNGLLTKYSETNISEIMTGPTSSSLFMVSVAVKCNDEITGGRKTKAIKYTNLNMLETAEFFQYIEAEILRAF